MKISRGEDNFVTLPAFAAKLYDSMMQSSATKMQYKEIAQDLVSLMHSGRLLDVGTGPGYLLREIHKLNPEIELHGIDISNAMVEQASRNLADITVDLQCGNIKATNYKSDFFDLVTCSGSFYLWDDPIDSLEEIYRILKLGGAAYLYETHRDINKQELWQKMRENLKGDNLIRKFLSPRFFIKQIGMTYAKKEIAEIIEKTNFVRNYKIEGITIYNLPVWVRVRLEKCT
ncbi:MAG: class I SAM-dependent methyltransferase [Chloroflexi bacterium]|jgi:ubiquinone/menaquinone biosynthesis C-methylase UbiE|nr:class I SAM-dependent methyltransferase [Chloroflexota bacterium]MBT3668629.1 class I SAM-dependent methyltransferase [Chloroflexota bacterium]MBT4002372.1 class I SAM-dependent methyltransferase [Chloroflexota bacterium]MBT4304431.1 class I SAM-dependent methyltransferase [Chloroflexota bacterium]MBT4532893.1 class I SAM-dependent methyltransferase [Chloroflexota bacterium]